MKDPKTKLGTQAGVRSLVSRTPCPECGEPQGITRNCHNPDCWRCSGPMSAKGFASRLRRELERPNPSHSLVPGAIVMDRKMAIKIAELLDPEGFPEDDRKYYGWMVK